MVLTFQADDGSLPRDAGRHALPLPDARRRAGAEATAAGDAEPDRRGDDQGLRGSRAGWRSCAPTVLRIAANRLNYGDDRWRVSLDELTAGDVRAVFSVLYEPFAEFDLDQPPGAPTGARLLRQPARPDRPGRGGSGRRRSRATTRTRSSRSGTDLDRVTGAGKVAFMHCIEGGFHLGGAIDEIDANVADARPARASSTSPSPTSSGARSRPTRRRSRSSATTSTRRSSAAPPALSELGVAAVEAMYQHKVLIDVSHMDQRAL